MAGKALALQVLGKDLTPKVAGLVKEFGEIIEALGEVVLWIIEFSETITKEISGVVETLTSLNDDKTDFSQTLATCQELLKQVELHSQSFASHTEDFCNISQLDEKTVEEMKQSAQNKDFVKFECYLRRLELYYEQCEEIYNEFEKYCKNTKDECFGTIKSCITSEKEARNKKITSRVIGGSAATAGAAAVAGAGVTTSIAAGAFTFGVGTVVGLGMTAVASGAVATVGAGTAIASGVVSDIIAKNYEKKQETFKELGKKFEKLYESVSGMKDKIERTHERLKYVLEKAKNVQSETQEEKDFEYDYFCRVLDMLVEEIRKKMIS